MTSATNPTTTGYTPDFRAGIDETNRRFEAAVAAGDAARAAREAYTRDCRVMPPGAATVVGRDAAEQFWAGAAAQLGLTAVALETVELQPLGDGAVEVGRATLTLGGGQQATAKFVVVWRQEEGRWRWHVDIWNMDA